MKAKQLFAPNKLFQRVGQGPGHNPVDACQVAIRRGAQCFRFVTVKHFASTKQLPLHRNVVGGISFSHLEGARNHRLRNH